MDLRQVYPYSTIFHNPDAQLTKHCPRNVYANKNFNTENLVV